MTTYRLYNVEGGPRGVCLLEARNGRLVIGRVVGADAILEILAAGDDGVVNAGALREEVASGRYLISKHDAEDWPLRQADVVLDLDELLGPRPR